MPKTAQKLHMKFMVWGGENKIVQSETMGKATWLGNTPNSFLVYTSIQLNQDSPRLWITLFNCSAQACT